jgi:hypothetical protein
VLDTYLEQVTDLLHDPNNQVWSNTQLTNYINEARNRVAQDTKCLRQILTPSLYPSLSFATGLEFIVPQTFLPATIGPYLVDTIAISVIINQFRRKLVQKSYTELDAKMRAWQGYQQWPLFWAKVSPTQYCIAPIPSTTYGCEWDLAVIPNPLVDDTTTEQLPVPFQEPVQYYACYKAKMYQQSVTEAEVFRQTYKQIRNENVVAWWGRSADPYAR